MIVIFLNGRVIRLTKVTTFGRLHLRKLLSSALARTMHRSRQRVKLPAVQAIVMTAGALACFVRKEK